MPNGERPHLTCLYCGADLAVARFRKTVYFETQEQAERYAGRLQPWQRAEIEDRLRMRELNPGHPEYALGTRFGVHFHDSLGGYGDNRFCGLRCGYKYALDHTKTAARARARDIAA